MLNSSLIHRNTNTSSNYYTSSQFTFGSSFTSTQIYNSRYIELTGNTYHYIRKSPYTVIVKMHPNDTIEWSKEYSVIPVKHSFDVAPNENYLCFCKSSSEHIEIIQINASDGSVLASLRTKNNTSDWSNVYMNQAYSILAISEDSTTVYISAYRNAYSSHYCRWVPSDSDERLH